MTTPVDPRDLLTFEKTLNDAASRANALWLSFVFFASLMFVTVGSVSHEQLFLERDLKLPGINLEISLIGFFVAAPVFLVVYHFYTLLQLHGLASKVALYDGLLREHAPVKADRRVLRQRLDSFVFVQMLAGVTERREGWAGKANHVAAWLTMVGLPMAVLILAQLIFLPYHHQAVTWWHRVMIIADLILINWFWSEMTSGKALAAVAEMRTVSTITASLRQSVLIGLRRIRELARTFGANRTFMILSDARTSSKMWSMPSLALVANLAVVIFSVFVAVFQTERMYEWRWKWLTTHFFEGEVDQVSSRSRNILANRLIVTNQQLVDFDEKSEISRSFRGRDLYGAVLSGSDLRNADFTGANLSEAALVSSILSGAKFNCSEINSNPYARGRSDEIPGAKGPWPDGCTWLFHAILSEARMEGAELKGARLNGAFFEFSDLQGADLTGAELVGTFLRGSNLTAATLTGYNIVAANFDNAHFDGSRWTMDYRPSGLMDPDITMSSFSNAVLAGASFYKTSLSRCRFDNTILALNFGQLRLRHMFDAKITQKVMAFEAYAGVNQSEKVRNWRDEIVKKLPIENMPPATRKVISDWGKFVFSPVEGNLDLTNEGKAEDGAVDEFLNDVVCHSNSLRAGPAVVGLLENHMIDHRKLDEFLSKPVSCPSAGYIQDYLVSLGFRD